MLASTGSRSSEDPADAGPEGIAKDVVEESRALDDGHGGFAAVGARRAGTSCPDSTGNVSDLVGAASTATMTRTSSRTDTAQCPARASRMAEVGEFEISLVEQHSRTFCSTDGTLRPTMESAGHVLDRARRPALGGFDRLNPDRPGTSTISDGLHDGCNAMRECAVSRGQRRRFGSWSGTRRGPLRTLGGTRLVLSGFRAAEPGLDLGGLVGHPIIVRSAWM